MGYKRVKSTQGNANFQKRIFLANNFGITTRDKTSSSGIRGHRYDILPFSFLCVFAFVCGLTAYFVLLYLLKKSMESNSGWSMDGSRLEVVASKAAPLLSLFPSFVFFFLLACFDGTSTR